MRRMILISFLLVFSFLMPGCTANLTAGEIADRSISAASNIQTYKLDSITENIYDIIGGSNPYKNTTRWSNSGIFDIRNQKMKMTSTIDDEYFGAKMSGVLDIYFINQSEFTKFLAPNSRWLKNPLTEELWNSKSQISQQVSLLKTATDITLAGSEKVEGIDCYLLDITPSIKSLTNWVISQQQPGAGPQLDSSNAPALAGNDIFIKTYQNSSIKMWIDKKTYLIREAKINVIFEAKPQDILTGWVNNPPEPFYTPDHTSFSKIISEFQGKMIFSDYNQPGDIRLPPEAFNARD